MPAETLEELVAHQGRRWEIERGEGMPQPRGPCVAISRLPASGGTEIAQRVAEWLDYGFFGVENVDGLVGDAALGRALRAGLDAAALAELDDDVARALKAPGLAASDYVHTLVRILTTLGERGMAVLLGRGGAVILPPRRALRVLVVAPRGVRAERLAAREALSVEAAGSRLDEQDAARRAFLAEQFDVEIDDPTLYDLVINTGFLSVDAAAAVVVDALRRRFPVRP